MNALWVSNTLAGKVTYRAFCEPRSLRRPVPLPPRAARNVSRVKHVLATLTAELSAPPNRFANDGFPCEAGVFRRGAMPLWTSLNMAGLPPELYQHPSARLMRLFLELEAEVS
jgi:hypothetical protein